jgi:hypothetical protein
MGMSMKKGAAKAGGEVSSVIPMHGFGWLFPGSPPPTSSIT